jgi:tripartite-type tricarboxylate transporter receptor subunit TctC
LETAFRKALQDPGFKDTMAKLSMGIIDMPGPQVREVVAAEMEKAKRLIAELKAMSDCECVVAAAHRGGPADAAPPLQP